MVGLLGDKMEEDGKSFNVDLAQEKWRDEVAFTTYYSQMKLKC